MAFNENWYPEQQILDLIDQVKKVESLNGDIVEIGCWEGRSTIQLANTCFPENLIAIDSWEGSSDDVSSEIAKSRNVYEIFLNNIQKYTDGNVIPIKIDCFEWGMNIKSPIKFVHLDASHHYNSVKRMLKLLLPHMIQGGILCGDDFVNANKNREDLCGGVERAVLEIFPNVNFGKRSPNLWWVCFDSKK